MKLPALLALVAGACVALKTARAGADAGADAARARAKASRALGSTSVVKTDVEPFRELKNAPSVSLEEKNLIDAWLFAERDEVNMFGDARGTKYEFGTPLKNADGTTRVDKYAYVKSRRSDAPWIAPYPKHWGAPPEAQTKDYVRLPGNYGYGSGTLKAWIEEKMAADAAADAAAKPTPTPKPTPKPTPTPEPTPRADVADASPTREDAREDAA